MGSKPCTSLQEEGKKKSAAYGQYELIVQKDRQYAIVHKSIQQNITNTQQLKRQLEKRKQIKSINLVSLCSFEIREDHKFIDLKMSYQFVPLTLADKMSIRRSLNKQLSESEVGNILVGIQSALRELYQIGIGHRCINLDTILCVNSLYKLSDITMITFLTGYDMTRQGDQNQFLSNQLLCYLQFQGTDPRYTINDDLFSLGMAILAVVLDCKPKHLYFNDKNSFRQLNRRKINEGIRIVQKKYGGWIEKRVRTLLEYGLVEIQDKIKGNQSRRRTTSSS